MKRYLIQQLCSDLPVAEAEGEAMQLLRALDVRSWISLDGAWEEAGEFIVVANFREPEMHVNRPFVFGQI